MFSAYGQCSQERREQLIFYKLRLNTRSLLTNFLVIVQPMITDYKGGPFNIDHLDCRNGC